MLAAVYAVKMRTALSEVTQTPGFENITPRFENVTPHFKNITPCFKNIMPKERNQNKVSETQG
jgi:hypothetical protein